MSVRRPPAWARRVAGLLIRGPQREFVLGDLDELYAELDRVAPVAVATYLAWVLRTAVHELRASLGLGFAGDLRITARQLRRRPRMYLGGALVLAVGMGVATVTWGVRYGSEGRDLPVSEPDRVRSLSVVDERTRARSDLSAADAEQLRREVRALDAVALWTPGTANLSDGVGPPLEVSAYEASADLFRVLEIPPLHGRTLLPSDELPGSPAVAVLGHRHWRDRYGRDPEVVGRSVRLDGVATEIVGVLPPNRGLTAHEAVWLPVGAGGDPTDRRFYTLVRLSAGAAPAAAREELHAFARGRQGLGDPAWEGSGLTLTTFAEAMYGGVTSVRDRVLGMGGALLFLMALANVSNLFLVTARVRARETAVRRALGAGRLRLVRQIALEAAAPAVLGGLGAGLIAAWGLAWYQVAADAYGIGFVWQVYRLEMPHAALIAAGALGSTVLVSLIASLGPVRARGSALLRSARGEVASTFRTGRALLAVEVAVGAALLLVASLMIRSGWNLRHSDYGFATENVMTGDLTLRGPAYRTPAARLDFWAALAARGNNRVARAQGSCVCSW